jgi:hypothetical protein
MPAARTIEAALRTLARDHRDPAITPGMPPAKALPLYRRAITRAAKALADPSPAGMIDRLAALDLALAALRCGLVAAGVPPAGK